MGVFGRGKRIHSFGLYGAQSYGFRRENCHFVSPAIIR